MTNEYMKALLGGEELVFQIWGAFSKDGDRSTPVTTALFRKGQRIGDGTLMEVWERTWHEEDGDTFELMHEFKLPDLPFETDEQIWAFLREIDHTFWKGWFYEGDR